MRHKFTKVVTLCICLCVCTGLLRSQALAADSMVYRENLVEFTGTDGLDLIGGTFTVKEFSITEGQDPEHRNYAGQTHALTDGSLTFEVGRSASEEVAAWFNARLSSYNDSAINGDRTTFDHTAGELNFAFIGTLSLAVGMPDTPETLTVIFDDVALAQGRDFLSNNWWFGQCTGQHTKDSDGAETLLAIGETDSGETVYASFLRGGNGVNEITLKKIAVVEDAAVVPQQITDVESAFQELPASGTSIVIDHFPDSYDSIVNHIQGFSPYQAADGDYYAVATHSVSNAEYAHIVAGPFDGAQYGFKTYRSGWRHPGGIQVMGDYLFAPSEQETTGQVSLYDLRALEVGELRRVETFELDLDHKAGALGITAYTDVDGVAYYLLVVAHLAGENSVYYVYRAPVSGGIESANFVEIGSFSLDKDFQGFGLVTEAQTNRVYMIGLWSPEEGASFADYAYLYQLDPETCTLSQEIDSIHMVSTGGGPGMLGIHFRYGAGVLVTNAQELLISATERNVLPGGALDLNTWKS